MGVARATFYKKPGGKRLKADMELKGRIDEIHVDFPGPHPVYRTTAELLNSTLPAALAANASGVNRPSELCGRNPL